MAENEDTKSKRDPLEWIKQKAAEVAAQAKQKAAETPRQMFLPGFDIGAFPNHLNRSSFIAPIARGRRKFHRQAAMVTRRATRPHPHPNLKHARSERRITCGRC